ncbi:hypothetical protein [Argonema galeatum]|uniref:hypothetical protein n=1 Tax=Argonema galeatum TaxID=2942762 RepID=UPI00201133D9|nr:hypothetical protein [Argonema galeatum]MCL1466134.1 hypothetical protein [Argonema galeatum A003/A1]
MRWIYFWNQIQRIKLKLSAIALSNSTSTIAPTSIPKRDRTHQFQKYDRTHIPHQKRSHSPIPKVRSHLHPYSNTIALSNPTSTIALTSITKNDRTLQLNKYDRTNIHHQKRSHSSIEQVRSHPHPSPKTIALFN